MNADKYRIVWFGLHICVFLRLSAAIPLELFRRVRPGGMGWSGVVSVAGCRNDARPSFPLGVTYG
jgi:hypothetical protein